ncbi:DNA gyrase subunit A [Candidatus Azambacteria bacterium]|nr:DNA gyrase subunit A [Candidatus Azambacteria bacterium]
MAKEEEDKFNIGKVDPVEITHEMQESYLNYAMSVIVSRALPDVRDGLKPVQRRILYSMHELGLKPSARFRKSALVVGDVLGKYHPHGDSSVYGALARMAQDFSMRYMLVKGQGNFGSIDGDSPAAMRYTEAKLTKMSEEMLFDIEKETVNFEDNYDGSRKEPRVLPSKVPQLLLNGQVGIAVGMATNIPPHNLRELVDAIIYLIDSPNAATEDILGFIKGPDFPTGGIVYDQKEILKAYSTGGGPMVMRGKADVVEQKSGKHQIVISEIPYQVNKASMIEKIADLVRDKKIEGIRDVRDESDKDGLRVVIDLKNDSYPQKILNTLYKLTDLQKTFHLNMVALVDGVQPQVLSLKSVLEYFIAHRKEVVVRRTQFELKKAKERAHILEGLKKALDHIDKIIATIKRSKNKEEAHQALMKDFKLSDLQASAILEMRLQTLSGLERKKIEDELKEKLALIADLEGILKSEKKILGIVKEELKDVAQKHGDERRTKIVKGGVSEFKEEDLIPEEDIFVALTRSGYIKRVDADTYKAQKRGGKGVVGMDTKEEDVIEHLFSCSTHDNILFFTDKGKVYQAKAFEVPESSRTSRGKAIINILDISQQERITAIVPVKERLGLTGQGKKESKEDLYLVMSTQNGIIKKVASSEFHTVRKSGVQAISLKGDDLLKWVRVSHGKDEIVILTKNGQAIRFSEKDVRAMGRIAAGVASIRMKKGDKVVGTDVIPNGKDDNLELLVVMNNGFGKRTELSQYKTQKRGGSGIMTAKITEKTGNLIASLVIDSAEKEKDLVAISNKGQVIRMSIAGVPSLSRATQGVRLMKLYENDKVASVTCL